MNLPEGVFQHFQQAKNFVSESVNSLTISAQQVGESWKRSATQTTDQAIDTVTTTLGQAKASVEETLQTANQIPGTTSAAVQTAMASSVNNWLTEHPAIFQVVKILGWAVNHPIISLLIIIFSLAILWNLIKAVGRFIELASLSILRVPLKLIQTIIKYSFLALTKVGGFAIKQLKVTTTNDEQKLLALPPATSQPIHKDKQQRLAVISHRLDALQKEQNLLLQEAAELMAVDTVDIVNKS